MEHAYVIPKAYAYVAYGDPAREMLDLLRIEVLGPADSHEVFAKKLSNLETTWVPMKVAVEDIRRLKGLKLVPEDHIGQTLHLSFPSLSRDKEMRFRLNRAFVGDGVATSYAGIDGHLGEDSIEVLVDGIEPVTWTA